MKKLYLAAALAACSLMSPAVQAQPGGGYGRPGGAGGPGGGMRGMRNNPKMRLGGFLRGVGHLESDKSNALSPSQAKAVVNAVTPWTKKSRMSESDAKALMARLNGILTAKQKSALEKAGPGRFGGERRDRPGGGRPGGGRPGAGRPGTGRPGTGRPGGPGTPPSAAQMEKMRNFMQNYNPLYPPTKYSELKQMPDRMRESFSRRYKSQQETLNALSRKARSAR